MSVSATNLTAAANTNITAPIVLTVQDANGTAVSGQTVTFTVTAGGGTLTGSTSATSDAQGKVTAPTWKLGKSADGQRLRAAVTGTSVVKDIDATVLTAFTIEVRFFGSRPISQAHQALFTAAAQRLMGIVTADVPNINGQIDMSACQVSGLNVVLNETIDDVIIFASSDTIDGKGGILGQAGPCYIRNSSTVPQPHTTITGAMQFDKDDLDNLLTLGIAQEVITHEMLHVLGVGTLWVLNTTNPPVNLMTGAGTIDPRYTGAEGKAGCQAVSGTVTCANSVPVEGNDQPQGTRDSHWRERTPGATFGNELMTGYVSTGSNPLSLLTLRSLADIGYTVNSADFDAYTIPGGVVRLDEPVPPAGAVIIRGNWEKVFFPKFGVDRNGKTTKLTDTKLPEKK